MASAPLRPPVLDPTLQGMHVESDGTRKWYRNGQLHREDGPALERPDGGWQWYLDGLCHRDGGLPAILYPAGSHGWFEHGRRHRLNGPAVDRADGVRQWWVEGIQIDEDPLVLERAHEWEEAERAHDYARGSRVFSVRRRVRA